MNAPTDPTPQAPEQLVSLGDEIEAAIASLPEDEVSLGTMLEHFGPTGLLLLTILLTLVFMIPVSIPGVSTVFGAAILLVGLSRLSGRPPWIPAKLRDRPLPAARLRSALQSGVTWIRRLEKVSKPHRLPWLIDSWAAELCNNLAFILGALLLMAPFGFIPFSNTLPGIALLFFAVGLMQRDGVAILLGHLGNLVTIIYFSILIGGGGLVLKEALHRLFPSY